MTLNPERGPAAQAAFNQALTFADRYTEHAFAAGNDGIDTVYSFAVTKIVELPRILDADGRKGGKFRARLDYAPSSKMNSLVVDAWSTAGWSAVDVYSGDDINGPLSRYSTNGGDQRQADVRKFVADAIVEAVQMFV